MLTREQPNALPCLQVPVTSLDARLYHAASWTPPRPTERSTAGMSNPVLAKARPNMSIKSRCMMAAGITDRQALPPTHCGGGVKNCMPVAYLCLPSCGSRLKSVAYNASPGKPAARQLTGAVHPASQSIELAGARLLLTDITAFIMAGALVSLSEEHTAMPNAGIAAA